MFPANVRRQSQRVALVLIVTVGTIATLVAYLGTRNPQEPAKAGAEAAPISAERVVLPNEEQPLPSGPHQRSFITSCTICHSTRLVMTQPRLSRKVWETEVQKMVKTYGAPIVPEAQEQIVEYLTAVHGE